MERDFMGLNSKELVVKEEIDGDGFGKGSGIHQPFPKKASSVYMMSFKAAQDEEDRKIELDSTVPPCMFATADAFERCPKRLSGQTQLIGGIPVPASHPVFPISDSSLGANQPWKGFRPSGSSPQLTIFYAGNVCVYDDISPEKAQAIMLLAGNGSSRPPNAVNPKPQSHVPSSKLAGGVGGPLHLSHNSNLPSPLSVSSPTGAQSGSGSTSTDEQIAAKAVGLPSTPISKMDPPRVVHGLGPVSIAAVPQARKASLARFLEKRKERVMNAAPYNSCKKPEHLNPDSIDFSATSVTDSTPPNDV